MFLSSFIYNIFSTGAYDSILSSYNRSHDAERLANESAITKSSIVVQSGNTRRRTERLMSVKKDDFNRKNAANKRALGDLSRRLQGLDMKKVNEKVGHSLNLKSLVSLIFEYMKSPCYFGNSNHTSHDKNTFFNLYLQDV